MSHPHEVQTLRQELTDTRKKLQDYADTIVSLHGELRNLRDGICKSCKRKFVPTERALDSSSLVKSSQKPAKTSTSTFSWRRLLKAHVSDHTPAGSSAPATTFMLPRSLPILSTPTYVPSPPSALTITDGNEIPTSGPVTTTTSSKAITPQTVPIVPRWSAERGSDTTSLSVTFVRALVHKGRVQCVRFSADGKYLAAVVIGDKNSVIFIYNAETGDKVGELAEYASQYSSITTPDICCVCFSPNGRFLVVGYDAGRVTVWDISKKRIRNKFRGPGFIRSVDFSPNGRLVASTSWEATVRIWNMRDGSARVFIDGGLSAYQYFVRFSPDGRFIATGDIFGMLRIWDARTGRLLRRTEHDDTIQSAAFTPDGRGLVSCSSDGVLKCWDVSLLGIFQPSGELVATKILESKDLINHISALSVSPDAQWIASSLSNGKTVIWDANSGLRQRTLTGHSEEVSSLDFSPVRTYLALGSHDSYVTLWRYNLAGT